MGTSSNPRKQHYTAILAANARALGYHNGKAHRQGHGA